MPRKEYSERPKSMSERLRELRALQALLLGLGTGEYGSITVIRADGTTLETAAQTPAAASDAHPFHREDASDYAGLPAADVSR